MKTTTTHLIRLLLVPVLILSAALAFMPSQTQAAFPGLNGKILFMRDNKILTARLDGSDESELTDNTSVNLQPAWSGDGLKIAYVSERDGNREIYMMDADGSNQVRLTNNPANDQQPEWSSDGSKIVFRSDSSGDIEVYEIDVDSLVITQLTNSPGLDGAASYSPDGQKIVFSSARDGNVDIFIMDANGQNQQSLGTVGGTQTQAQFSPDGQKITYQSNQTGQTEVFVVDADGTNPVQITNDANPSSAPNWFSDGSRMIFVRQAAGIPQLFTMNTDGSDAVQITNEVLGSVRPYIQPLTIPPATIDASPTIDATSGSAVYDTVANHTDAYEEIDPSSVTISSQPTKGDVSVNSSTGEITYTANTVATTSFLDKLSGLFFPKVYAQGANQDSFSYQVCSTANALLCTTATVSVGLASAAPAEELAETGTSIRVPALFSISLLLAGVFILSKRGLTL